MVLDPTYRQQHGPDLADGVIPMNPTSFAIRPSTQESIHEHMLPDAQYPHPWDYGKILASLLPYKLRNYTTEFPIKVCHDEESRAQLAVWATLLSTSTMQHAIPLGHDS